MSLKRDDVPKSDWKLSQLKDFCEEKKIIVLPGNSKRPGALVYKDYYEAAKKYCEDAGIKYKADSIMESYGVLCVRLPPYHPELNPIGKCLSISIMMIVFFSLLGISYLLIFEWIRNALIFFLARHFFIPTLVRILRYFQTLN